MKKESNLLMKRLLIIIVLLLAINTTNAQSCGTCPPPPTGIGFDDDVNDEVPISGFLALGLAIGAIYGIRKVK